MKLLVVAVMFWASAFGQAVHGIADQKYPLWPVRKDCKPGTKATVMGYDDAVCGDDHDWHSKKWEVWYAAQKVIWKHQADLKLASFERLLTVDEMKEVEKDYPDIFKNEEQFHEALYQQFRFRILVECGGKK